MKILKAFVVIFVFFAMLKPMIHVGYPLTHDGIGHLARMANYYLAVRQGQTPPRIAPTFMGGYGYPVFNYNYPLMSMLSLPFVAIKIPIEIIIKLILISLLFFGTFGMYKFLKKYVGSSASFFASMVYVAAPFLFNDMYVRGAFGEVCAYAVLPHVLLSLYF